MIVRWYCVVSALVLILAGFWLYFLVLPLRPDWLLGFIFQMACLVMMAKLVVSSKPLVLAGAQSAWPFASKPAVKAVPEELRTAVPNGDSPFCSDRLARLLIVAALGLDLLYLAFGQATGLSLGRLLPAFFPGVWSSFLASFYYAARLTDPKSNTFSACLSPILAISLHLFLTILSHDLYAARSQAGIMFLWALIFNRGLWPRVLTFVVVVLYLPAERLIVFSQVFGFFDKLDSLSLMSAFGLALDQSLKEAAYRSAGFWGFGWQYVTRLDLVAPELMHLNAFSYLTAMWGLVGLLVYGGLVLSLLLAIGWLLVKTNSDRKVVVVLPAWLLVTTDQYLGLIIFQGWRGYGQTHPPAFVGGFDITFQVLFLALLALNGLGRRKCSPPASTPLPLAPAVRPCLSKDA
ncbi:MAG: hypothetical protein LBT47_03845 [Deltaproteobacteria bacterium]|nr:hypothetical protein [Deltaproteobacteria bacterium]